MLQPTVLDFLEHDQSTNGIDEHNRYNSMASVSTTKQKLRPWLEGQLNRGDIEGVEWVDKSQMIFKLPWKHGGKSDWGPDDSELFKAWAKNTGKYREGQDKVEYAKWKTRVRCAMNKASDIKELRDRHGIDEPKPYKVYQFLPKKDSRRTEVPNIGLTHEEESSMLSTNFTMGHDFLQEVQFGDQVPPFVQNLTAAPVYGQDQFTTTFSSRQPIENDDSTLGGFSEVSQVSEVTMSGLEEGRLPSDLVSLPSGDLILKSMQVADLQTYMDVEMETTTGPTPMPSYDRLMTDTPNFLRDLTTGGAQFIAPPGDFGPQQSVASPSQIVTIQTANGTIQIPSHVNIKVTDVLGTSITCIAGRLDNFQSHLRPPINIEVVQEENEEEMQEEPQKQSIKLDHAYGVMNAPLVKLDTYMFRGYEMRVTLYYFGKVLYEYDLLQPQGYCFHFGCDSKIQKNIEDKNLATALMGPEDMHRCPFPDIPPNCEARQKQNIQVVLNGLARGFAVFCQEGNIFITRYCKTRVFVTTSEQRVADDSLPRQMVQEVFRYKNYEYKLHNESLTKPDPAVYIGLAQKWDFGKKNDNLAVTMKIACSKALQICNRIIGFEETLFVDANNDTSVPYEISKSTSMDYLAKRLQEQSIRSPPQS